MLYPLSYGGYNLTIALTPQIRARTCDSYLPQTPSTIQRQA